MDQMTAPASRRGIAAKSASAFRTISEVSDELDVPQHVLRFWETKFSHIKPLKRGGGRRYYRPEDLALLRRIRELLYTEGYTIKGVQRLLRQNGVKAVLGGMTEDRPEADDDAGAAIVASAAAAAAAPQQRLPAQSQRPLVAPPEARPGLDSETRAALKAVLAELTALRAMLP
jgi:DNA-binding transcriptional MerR regulator